MLNETGHVVNVKWHDQDRCAAALTLRAAAQLRTFLECSGTMSCQLEGALGNSTSVLKILHLKLSRYRDDCAAVCVT